MAEGEIKYRIKADADQAQRETRKATKETKRLEEAVDDAGSASGRMAGKISRARDATKSLGGSVTKTVAAIGGISAVVGGATAALRDMAQAAKEAMDNLISLGQVSRSLSTNIGGDRTAQIRRRVNQIATNQALGKTGRNQLIQAATTATDLDPSLTNEQLVNRLRGTAKLSRSTDTEPDKAFRSAQKLSASLNIPFSQAVDQATVLGTSGFEPRGIQQAAERFAGLEGRDVLSLMLAAREEMDPNAITEGLNTLRNALTRQGADGGLHKDLRSLGLTNEMDFVQKIRALREGRQAGRISDADIQSLGGTRAQGVFQAFSEAIPRLDQARRSLSTGRVEDVIRQQRESEVVQAAERANRRELERAIASEESGMGGAAETVAEHTTNLQTMGGGSTFLGAVEAARGGIDVGLFKLGLKDTASVGDMEFQRGGGTTNINVNNVNGQQVNQGKDPQTGDLDKAAQGERPN